MPSLITENIRKALDHDGCGVFADLQKAFDTADHYKLLAKLNHYGIRGVSNDYICLIVISMYPYFAHDTTNLLYLSNTIKKTEQTSQS